MTFRDKSADVTLNNANEGIMSDSKYAKSDPRNPDPKGDFASRARLEAEIDALKNELSLRAHGETRAHQRVGMLNKEVAALKAENVKLRADAERLCKAAEEFQGAASELWKSENPDETTGTIMSLDDAMLLHDESWRALNSAIHYMRKSAAIKDFSTRQKEEGEA